MSVVTHLVILGIGSLIGWWAYGTVLGWMGNVLGWMAQRWLGGKIDPVTPDDQFSVCEGCGEDENFYFDREWCGCGKMHYRCGVCHDRIGPCTEDA